MLPRIALFHEKTRWADESTGGVSFRRVLPSSRCHRSPLNYLRNRRLFCCSDIRLKFFVRFRMMFLRPVLWSTGSFALLFFLWALSIASVGRTSSYRVLRLCPGLLAFIFRFFPCCRCLGAMNVGARSESLCLRGKEQSGN